MSPLLLPSLTEVASITNPIPLSRSRHTVRGVWEFSSLRANDVRGASSGRDEGHRTIGPLDPVADAHFAVDDLKNLSLAWR